MTHISIQRKEISTGRKIQKEKRNSVKLVYGVKTQLLREPKTRVTKRVSRGEKATSRGQEKEERAHTGALRDHAVEASILKNQCV